LSRPAQDKRQPGWRLVHLGHQVVGFDLNEVGPSPYDANVGMRLLYELCMLSLR
jgi:hypothetical protein